MTKKNRVVFAGSPEFALPALEALHAAEDFEVSLVVTQKDKRRNRRKLEPTPVKRRALELGIPVVEPDKVSDPEWIERLREEDPDFIVVIAYGQILRKPLLDAFPDRIVNVHASILPQYRGAAPIHRVLMDGVDETGVSIMLIDEGLDDGDVLKIGKIPVEREDNVHTLTEKLAFLGAEELLVVLRDFETYEKNRAQQVESEATYAAKIDKETGHIRWSMKAKEIENALRALSPQPGIFFIYNDQRVKIHKIHTISAYTTHEPGKVFRVSADGIFVNCADGCIVIEKLQFPGKKPVAVSDYLRGNSFPEGVQLL